MKAQAAALEPAEIEFDGDGLPRSRTYGDLYHPREGAREQAQHVFLAGNDLPARWQGWVCLLTYVAVMAGSAAWILPEHPILFGTVTGVLSAIFIGICYWKGETPKWRWGGKPL